MSVAQPLPPSALADVIKERQRQITEERAMPALDDQHTGMQLARAAGAYALFQPIETGQIDPDKGLYQGLLSDLWPDDFTDFKPADHRRNCVRSAALLLAEIERLDRIAHRQEIERLARIAAEGGTITRSAT